MLCGQQGFACRDIGQDASILDADYAMACESSDYDLLSFACIVLTLLWPIGVPGFLFYNMFKVRKEIMEEDKDALQKFDFVCATTCFCCLCRKPTARVLCRLGDYDKEHWCDT